MLPIKDNEGVNVAARIGRAITDWMGCSNDPTAYPVNDPGPSSLDIPDGDWEGSTDIVTAKPAAKAAA